MVLMEDSDVNGQHPPATGARFPQRFRLYQTRTRTGCLVCRGRRKKCDEVKPTCLACWRNGSQCTWPETVCPKPLNTGTSASDAFSYYSSPGAQSQATQRSKCPEFVASDAPSSQSSDRANAASEGHNAPTRNKWPHILVVFPGSISLQELASSQRALYLTPSSCTLFSHYIAQTGGLIAAKPLATNAFLTLLVPMANLDDLVMHAIIALSGVHLDFQGEAQPQIRLASSTHYGLVLRGLRHELIRSSELSIEKLIRLSLVFGLLCHIEAVSGNTSGSIFSHLRAWREIILCLLNRTSSGCPEELRNLEGFVVEVYSYLALVSNITPYGLAENRTLEIDPFLTSLGQLKRYKTFGTFLGCGSSLFELIPPISMLAAKRLKEEAASLCSDESIQTFDCILSRLDSWEPTAVTGDMAPWRTAHIAVGEFYRHALYIYLKTAMCGSIVSDHKTICEIQQHIHEVFAQSQDIFESPFGTIMLWPTLITGSCILRDDQRQLLRDRIQSLRRWRFTLVLAMRNLLELLWNSNDKHAYGPYGLFLTMKKHNIDFCMA